MIESIDVYMTITFRIIKIYLINIKQDRHNENINNTIVTFVDEIEVQSR